MWTIAGPARLVPAPRAPVKTPSMNDAAAPRKKATEIDVLRCLASDCRGMLAYEVTTGNVLVPDLHWMARRDGDTRYFPCPSCGGRNVVEEVRDAKGVARHAVTRYEKADEDV